MNAEKYIKEDLELRELDQKLSIIYKMAINNTSTRNKPHVLAKQRDFHRLKDKICGPGNDAVNCLKKQYRDRISDLKALAGGYNFSSVPNLPVGEYEYRYEDEYGGVAGCGLTVSCEKDVCDVIALSGSLRHNCDFRGEIGLDDFIKTSKDEAPVYFKGGDMTMGVVFYKDSAIIKSFGSTSQPDSRDFALACGSEGGYFIMDQKIYKTKKP
jgi:hypothetical protein